MQVLIFGSFIALSDRAHGGLDAIFGWGAAAKQAATAWPRFIEVCSSRVGMCISQ